jgi:hypothetical protein
MHGLVNGIGKGGSGVRLEDLHAQMQRLNRQVEELEEMISASSIEMKG